MSAKKPPTPREKKAEETKNEITRKVAIAFVFVGVFYFFIKLLFF